MNNYYQAETRARILVNSEQICNISLLGQWLTHFRPSVVFVLTQLAGPLSKYACALCI